MVGWLGLVGICFEFGVFPLFFMVACLVLSCFLFLVLRDFGGGLILLVWVVWGFFNWVGSFVCPFVCLGFFCFIFFVAGLVAWFLLGFLFVCF